MQISVVGDIKRIGRDLAKIKKTAIPTATRQAINRTATGVKTDVVRDISKTTGIKQKDVRSQVEVYKATKTKLQAKVDAKSGKARNLINYVREDQRKSNVFNHRRKLKSGRRGKVKSAGVRARAWGKSKVYRGTFIGTGRNSGKPLVFSRQANGKLKAIKGPSIRTEFDRTETQNLMKNSIAKRFPKAMSAAVNNQLNKIR